MTEHRLFDLHGAIDFDWDAIDPLPDPDDVATAIVAEVLSFVFAFVFAGTATTATAFRRFVAVAYIVRPDLLQNRSQARLAHELKVTKSEVARHVAAVRDELGVSGAKLLPVAMRLKIKAGQLRARQEKLRPPLRAKKKPSRPQRARRAPKK